MHSKVGHEKRAISMNCTDSKHFTEILEGCTILAELLVIKYIHLNFYRTLDFIVIRKDIYCYKLVPVLSTKLHQQLS